MEPSQVLNKLLGRGTDTGGVEFWRQPERSGWLMKQGEQEPVEVCCRRRSHILPCLTLLLAAPNARAGEFVKTWRRR